MDQTNETVKRDDKDGNPFVRPTVDIWRKVCDIPWGARLFLPQLIQFLVQLIVLLILGVLCCTIGVVFTCYSTICKLLAGLRGDFKDAEPIGKSAYAVMAVIYLLLLAPCWIVVMPFMLLGWCWARFMWLGLLLYAVVVGLLVVIVVCHDSIFCGVCTWFDGLMSHFCRSA